MLRCSTTCAGPRTPFQPRRKWTQVEKKSFADAMDEQTTSLLTSWATRCGDHPGPPAQLPPFEHAGDWMLQDLLPAVGEVLVNMFPWTAPKGDGPVIPSHSLEFLTVTKKYLHLCTIVTQSDASQTPTTVAVPDAPPPGGAPLPFMHGIYRSSKRFAALRVNSRSGMLWTH